MKLNIDWRGMLKAVRLFESGARRLTLRASSRPLGANR